MKKGTGWEIGGKSVSSRTPGPSGSRPQPPDDTTTESWSTVVRRGTKAKGADDSRVAGNKAPKLKTTQSSGPTPRPKGAGTGTGGKGKGKARAVQSIKGQPASNNNSVNKKRKIRLSKEAAILISMPSKGGAEMDTSDSSGANIRSLEEVITSIRGDIKFSDYRITSLRPKRAATGGILYEVPRVGSEKKADKLAAQLKTLLELKGMRVTRPVKRAELRITGLDDSIAPEDVRTAVATAGGCSAEEVKVGKIGRSAAGGLGSIWVQCPAVAAKKVANPGFLEIAWIRARIEVLGSRPLQCFRCLGAGHTRAQCKEIVDRSDLCYRCGLPGHKAAECSADPQCPHCKGRGLKAEHRYGGKACAFSRPIGKKKDKGTAKKTVPHQQEAGTKGATKPTTSPPATKPGTRIPDTEASQGEATTSK
ncbi:gag-like protein [Lasius niger]|uniref:Gag-like protein n=1 Tax=Lasius niger TaxID=67767 RepID=A0A0J7K864_LASNI|nr:gag-like protein [Lasius niger]